MKDNRLTLPPGFQPMPKQSNANVDRLNQLETTFIDFMKASKNTQEAIQANSNNIYTYYWRLGTSKHKWCKSHKH